MLLLLADILNQSPTSVREAMDSIKHCNTVAMRHRLMRTDSKNVNVSKTTMPINVSLALGDGSDLVHLELGIAAQGPAEKTAALSPGGIPTISGFPPSLLGDLLCRRTGILPWTL